MRIAAISAGTLVAVGLYLAIAATAALPASLIGIGVLTIAMAAAVAMVGPSPASA